MNGLEQPRRTFEVDGVTVLPCCGAQEHPWERFLVASEWSPVALHCMVIGESPGEDAAKCFYNGNRKVAVRTIMLRELQRHRLINKATLPEFRKAGFLFDHAIRCLLPAATIQHEVNLASRYESPRAAAASHLVPFLQQNSAVWVMGRIARNAVAVLRQEFPKDRSEISKPPYPGRVLEAPRFFVSRYLLHASHVEIKEIFTRLHHFLDENSANQCSACFNTI